MQWRRFLWLDLAPTYSSFSFSHSAPTVTLNTFAPKQINALPIQQPPQNNTISVQLCCKLSSNPGGRVTVALLSSPPYAHTNSYHCSHLRPIFLHLSVRRLPRSAARSTNSGANVYISPACSVSI